MLEQDDYEMEINITINNDHSLCNYRFTAYIESVSTSVHICNKTHMQYRVGTEDYIYIQLNLFIYVYMSNLTR